MCWDQGHLQFPQDLPKLRVPLLLAFQLIFHRQLFPRLIRRVLVCVHALRYSVFPYIPSKTVHRRKCPFVIVKPRIEPSRRIVDISHQHHPRTTPFQPIMVRPIHLHHHPIMAFTLTPPSMGSPPALPAPLLNPQPLPERLDTHPLAFLRFQLLARKRRPKSLIPSVIHFHNPPSIFFRILPVRCSSS